MTKSRFLSICVLVATVIAAGPIEAFAQKAEEKKRVPNPALAPVEDVEGLPRVLLIGDSISMGYTVPVREKLAGKANVHRPLTNCGPTTTGVANIDEWLKTGGEGKKWDVVHFNWGLHDLKYLGPDGKGLGDPDAADSKQQVPPTEYKKNLETLVARLGKTGAKLIWRNTTPVPEGAAGRVPGDAAEYNLVAAEVMTDAGIQIHDLYAFAKEHEAEIQRPANVHYTPEGSDKLADEVVKVILEALGE